MSKTQYDKFGKILVEKFRDEIYLNHLESINYASSMTIQDYYNLDRDPSYDKELQKIDDERFEFLNSLTVKQREQLNKLILKTLDEVAFNVLREVEEGQIDNSTIGLTFEGDSIKNIYNEFLSGTFFGEYFLWLESFSEYGNYQY